MIKKIGDLTLKEIQQICISRPAGFDHCKTCPLYHVCQRSFNYDDEDLNKEIEVNAKMKKKIKNTTLEERKKICDKYKDCFDCPFVLIVKHDFDNSRLVGNKCNIYLNDNGTNLDQEIEVDENA